VAEFAERMNRVAAQTLSEEDCVATLDVAMEIDPAQVTHQLLSQLDSLAPFGAANAKPFFVSRGVRINEVKSMGKESEHLKLILGIEGVNRWDTVDAPWFYRGDMMQALGSIDSLDFCYEPSFNDYNGKRSIQFLIQDINAPEW
jgi:single-stranded-DNA-specific exonuclease